MTSSQEAKEKLKEVKKLDNLIESKRREIIYLREKLYYKGLSYGEKIQGSFQSDQRENMIASIVDYEAELHKDIDKLIELKKEISTTIDKIEDADCVNVLYKRYFEYKTWEKISDEMFLTPRRVLQIHGKALIQFYKRLH